MKIFNILLMVILGLGSLPSFANDTTLKQHTYSLKEIDQAIDSNEFPLNDQSSCLPFYIKRKKQLISKSLINPLIAIPTSAAGAISSAYVGAFLGEVITGSSGWGSIIGSAWGTLIGVFGGAIFFTTREAVLVTKYINNKRVIKLLEESYGVAGPIINHIKKNLFKAGQELSEEHIQSIIITMDQDQALCDGSLKNYQGKKLKRKLLTVKQITNRIQQTLD